MSNTKRRNHRRRNRSRRNRSRRKKFGQLGGEGLTKYSIMSYNILARGATSHQEAGHKFHFENNTNPIESKPSQYEHIEQTLQRFIKIVDEIKKANPDIVLLQEVDNYFYTYLLKHLPIYTGYFKLYIPVPRGDLSANFATAIIWKSDLFELMSAETLDSESYYADQLPLIEEVDRIKSPFDNKNATLVTLREKKSSHTIPSSESESTADTISVVSVHLPGDKSKQNSAIDSKKRLISYILQKMANNTAKLKLIGGDLNCPIFVESCPTDTEIVCCYRWISQQMAENGFEKVNQETSGITTCDFDYSSKSHDQTTIDTIFFSANSLEYESYSVQDMDCPDGESSVYKSGSSGYADIEYGSDHAWILTNLKKRMSE